MFTFSPERKALLFSILPDLPRQRCPLAKSARFMDRVTNKATVNSSAAPILPSEIIYSILLLHGPHELIPLRTVSKQFCAIIDDPIFWRIMYTDAHLPRPPGPFAWQSTKFLQRTLVHSARLAQGWTSRPMNVFLRHSLRGLTGPSTWANECSCGRWLIICTGSKQLVSHDFRTGSEQLLCRWGDPWVSWSATSCLGSTRGHLLYVGLCAENGHSGDRVKLLEFQADDDSGHLSSLITSNVPVSCHGPGVSLRVQSGDTPFVLISVIPLQPWRTCNWIFDTRNQIFYKFPKLVLEPGTEQLTFGAPDPEFILTMTHIIHSYVSFSISDLSEIVQAYVIPNDNETHELRLSHETTSHISTVPRLPPVSFLLRNSVIDPITGSNSLRLLHALQSHHNQQFLCTDITLPANSTADVLPLSISTHLVFNIADPDGMCISLLSSTDGFARGLCVVAITSAQARIHKFTIDGTGETCVGVVGDVFPLSPVATYRSLGSFDGTRGRQFLTMNRDREAVVLDIE